MTKQKKTDWFWHRIVRYDTHPEQVGDLFALEHIETDVIVNLCEEMKLVYLGTLPKSTLPSDVVKHFKQPGGDQHE